MRLRPMSILIALLAGLSTPVIAQDAVSAQETRQAAQAVVDAYNKAVKNKDAAALGTLYADDAFLVTPDGIIPGRAAIEKFSEDSFKVFDEEAKLDRVEMLGKVVRVRSGTWAGIFHAQKGPVPMKGYWSTTDVLEGGKWKIRMETFNATPPSGASN
jgi:uncharacterized protein (TIGR02246 family)